MKKGFPLTLPLYLRVPQDDIKSGIARDCKKCPVARVFQRLLGAAYQVRTHTQATHVYPSSTPEGEINAATAKPLWSIRHPYRLANWIRGYDGQHIPPTRRPIEVTITENFIS